MENELDLTQEQIDNMTQEEWDNLPIVTGPDPSRSVPGIDGTIKLSNEELKNPSTQKGPSPKLSAYKTPTVWEMKNYHGGIKPLNVKQSYEFDYDKHEDAALPQQEGEIKDWDGETQLGSSGPFGVIGGGGFKIAKGIYSAIKNPQKIKQVAGAFANTAKQYLGLAKGAPKADVAKKLTDHYTPHRNRLMKEGMSETEVFNRFPTKDMMTPEHLSNIAKAAKPTSNFKPLVTGNKVYDTKMVNDAFAKRFSKPQTVKPANTARFEHPNVSDYSKTTGQWVEKPSGYVGNNPASQVKKGDYKEFF